MTYQMALSNRTTAQVAIATSTLLLIGLIALGGNLLVVISIYRNPILRKITNYFVFSLAMTDIMYCLFGLSFTLVSLAEGRWIFGTVTCHFQSIWTQSLTYISMYTISIMAINRFVRVCKSSKYNSMFNHTTSLVVICLVWVLSFGIVSIASGIPNSLFYSKFDPSRAMCHNFYSREDTVINISTIIFIVANIVFQMFIIIFCYFNVFKTIKKHTNSVAPSSNTGGLGTSPREIKITWTLFAVLLGYVSTWVPVLIVMLISNISPHHLSRETQMIVTYAGTASSAINPIIYGITNP
ncbi:melatonin receptor type 1A-like [Actinia tenebrosa]|uniref:Melatonin receptor type 1A-like n=1 Tax=Actinia tenebrosa TaxID=6105 RepID=A0A6P8HUW2_ACTTE|nr:melatonin receptor type 1A-like [Actinia tenebrosa]